MKDRIKKKDEKRRRQAVLEILDLVMRKNNGTASVFFRFAGHVNHVSVDIHKDGYPNKVTCEMGKFLDRNYRDDTDLEEMKTVLEAL